jgi:hypothetical protein
MPIIKNTGRRKRTRNASGKKVKAYGRDKDRNRQGRQPSTAKEKKPEKLSKKEISSQFWDGVVDDYKKNNVTSYEDGGYTESSVSGNTETRIFNENKNGKTDSGMQSYQEGYSKNIDYNYLDENIDEYSGEMRMLLKNIDGKLSTRNGFKHYDKDGNLKFGSYNAYGEDKDISFSSYKARQEEIESKNKGFKLRSEAYDKLTGRDFKEHFRHSKAKDKRLLKKDLARDKQIHSTGYRGLGGIEDGSYIVGEENAKPFLNKYESIKTQAQNIDSRFKLGSERFNNLTGGKKSKLKFG